VGGKNKVFGNSCKKISRLKYSEKRGKSEKGNASLP